MKKILKNKKLWLALYLASDIAGGVYMTLKHRSWNNQINDQGEQVDILVQAATSHKSAIETLRRTVELQQKALREQQAAVSELADLVENQRAVWVRPSDIPVAPQEPADAEVPL